MGRRGGWSRGVALALAVIAASCGGTGGGPSDSGNPLVFQARGRLNLIVQPTNDPRVLTLIATLLDPQGVPFRNQAITFTAGFPDATFIPGEDNQGSALTDNNGQAKITLVAGLTTGDMQVLAEAPPALNIATGVTVRLTAQGFLSLGPLGIIPTEVTFINPLVGPDAPGPMTVFNATGGTPPYRWNNRNKSIGRIEQTGLPNINETATYTLIGPISVDVGEDLQDTVELLDADGTRQEATVNVIFTDCSLNVSPTRIDFTGATGGEQFQITITGGVPPYTATHLFPDFAEISIDQQAGIVTYTVATPPTIEVSPDTLLIRDSRGCTAIVEVFVQPAPAPAVTTIVLEANPLLINGITGGTSTITATVLDENNQPIPGISVLFTDDSARATIDPLTATTDSSGRATTTLRVPSLTPAGIVQVTGSAREVSGSVNLAITTPTTGEGGPPADIFVDLFANGSGNNNDTTCTTVLSALVVDAEGNPVNDGTRVDWEAPPPATGGVVAVSSPSFTGQDPPSECNLSPLLRDLNIEEITPQPGDALTCLKYPRSLSAATINVTATATGQGATASDNFQVILPPCPFTPTGLAITPAAITLSPGQSQQFVITGGVPPYQVTVNGGTVGDPPAVTTTVDRSGGSFVYTAGSTQGEFLIIVTDASSSIQEATVNIAVATLPVSPEEGVVFCGTNGGETARITILAGVPPFTATHTFNSAGSLRCEEQGAIAGETVTCQTARSIIYTVELVAPSSADPDSVIIQDSEGKAATVSVSINGADCDTDTGPA